MMSLFSSFDLYFNNFFLLSIMSLIFMFFVMHFKLNYFMMVNQILKTNLTSFFYSLKPKSFSKSASMMLSSLFLGIFLFNFLSIFCYIFPSTSQISIVLSMGLIFWLGFMMFFLVSSMKSFLSHCIPEGTPMMLISLLFMIELLSNLIRPITVTVRLVANILAGHLLMILLSELVLSMFSLSFLYVILNSVEIFVSLIQAYIFVTMLTLYYTDIS